MDIQRGEYPRTVFLYIFVFFIILLTVPVSAEEKIRSITFHYSGTAEEQQTITVDYSDEWLLQPDNVYNHKLMQASFGLAAAGFRDKEHDLLHKDFNILNFFAQLGFTDPQTDDFNKMTSINTIGTAIAHKKVGDAVVIAVSVSGNNYQNEWQSNLTIDDENRPAGFNAAAGKVLERLKKYISTRGLSGSLRLWISGYSRAAAVSNITAAEAVDSGLFDAVYGYTIATPRTTQDKDADKYSNIFNVINPFDPVPMVPYPEWGFVRYGTDLFLPSMETDSSYAEKKIRADKYCMEAYGHTLHYNPEVNAQLHTILDMSLYFINSSKSYQETYQNGILDIWKNRDPVMLIDSIVKRIAALPEITVYQLNEFTEMVDYLLQIAYTDLRYQILHVKDAYWDDTLSLKENVVHEHFDEVYRSWLFSSDDPDMIYLNDPGYIHFSVLGDVDVNVYDEEGSFLFEIRQDGKVLTDLRDQDSGSPAQTGIDLFASRHEKQTLIVFPMDRFYLAAVTSHQDENIRIAHVMYSAKELRGNLQYVLSESIEKDDSFYGNIDPEMINEMTDEQLLDLGIHKIEPWSQEIVYSPSAVMRLENTGIFHPSVRYFLSMGGLILLFMLFILILTMIGAGKGVIKGVRNIRNRGRMRTTEIKTLVDDTDKE